MVPEMKKVGFNPGRMTPVLYTAKLLLLLGLTGGWLAPVCRAAPLPADTAQKEILTDLAELGRLAKESQSRIVSLRIGAPLHLRQISAVGLNPHKKALLFPIVFKLFHEYSG